MTRNYLSAARKRRVVAPPVPRPRHPAVTPYGFTCFRLVDGDPIELMHSTSSMFVFVRGR